MFSPQEYSVNHSINACSSVEENVDTLSHQESDHEQLKAENNELRYDTDNIAPHPEYSVNHSINICSLNEEKKKGQRMWTSYHTKNLIMNSRQKTMN